jgi:two-component system, OmpR family, sensor histidine kinase KdpD
MRDRFPRWIGYPASVLVVAGTVGLLKLFPQLTVSSAALLLLLAVFLCASVWQSGPGVVAALIATLALNFFFYPPLYTFTIEDPRNVAALFVFLVSALLIGRLSALARRRLGQLEDERRDLLALTQLSQGFLADTNREALFGVAADRLREAMRAKEVAIVVADEKGELTARAQTPGSRYRSDLVELAFRQGNSAAFPSELGGTDIYLPVNLGVHRVGALAALGIQSSERLAEACATLLGLALERERFLRIARDAEVTRASDDMKTTLLAALAHDLKTPVATARGTIENWASRAGPEDSRPALDAIASLTRQIDDLMKVVRLDAGVAVPRRERVTAREIVEAAVARFGEALGAHSLYLDLPPGDIELEVDPSQLTEALGQGLRNAALYSAPGSEVRVSVAEADDQARFEVTDRGRGVPEKDRDRVFDRFVRLPDAETVEGSGLGLFIARRLVEMNGGRVRLLAAEPTGARFEMLVPRAAE